jgi:hypothetical protein
VIHAWSQISVGISPVLRVSFVPYVEVADLLKFAEFLRGVQETRLFELTCYRDIIAPLMDQHRLCDLPGQKAL